MERPHLRQEPLDGSEKTKPELSEIRKLFEKHLPTKDVTQSDIDKWLQAAPLSKGSEGSSSSQSDNECEKRALKLAKEMKPEKAADPQPKLFALKITSLKLQWDSVDEKLKANTPVVIKGVDTFIGGSQSNFSSGRSHHVIIFLAVGDGYYIGFDPDVSATTVTREAWKTAISTSTLDNVISDMILSPTDKVKGPACVLGPLCRKYYPDKDIVFPGIPRFNF